MQSKELTEYYRAYLAWAESGAESGDLFDLDYALCDNVENFYGDMDIAENVRQEMSNQFFNAGLHTTFPFNTDNNEFDAESLLGRHHLNEKRINWVKNHLEEI